MNRARYPLAAAQNDNDEDEIKQKKKTKTAINRGTTSEVLARARSVETTLSGDDKCRRHVRRSGNARQTHRTSSQAENYAGDFEPRRK